ncbi:TetR family transcriptional regulator [Leifsonia sp. C5G2]|uniref:acyl-CoA-like ligand-binding transcription factor n=1 Tax=Leifsonia sp. C5G2 TaxID=2735269 RepID=UPI001584D3DB
MNSPQATETRRRRGRPAAGDPERVALLALRRFASHGYEATTMEAIADLAGIGRRTLFRYFPSKPDLVWGGMEPVVERMHRVLDSPGAGESTRDVIARAMTESLDLDPDTLEATRLRLRLMASDPALIAFGVLRLTASRDLIAGFLGRRLGAEASELRVRVLADAISSANFSALLWWATNRDDDDPARASVEALDALLDLHLP